MQAQHNFFNALSPLPLPEEVRTWDAEAVNMGLPEVMLMENAGRAAFDVLRHYVPRMHGLRVTLFMGGGNNGGDAACLARRLLDAGACPLVLHAKDVNASNGAAAEHVRMAMAAGVPFAPLRHDFFTKGHTEADVFVDGLLGTGFEGELRPEYKESIAAINKAAGSRFVLALDLPSGLNAQSGLPSPLAIKASATATFAAAKPGLALPEARAHIGHLHVCDVGIPRKIRLATLCHAYLLDGRCLSQLPKTTPCAYKNKFGHSVILGGSAVLTGAPHLAALGALRAGAGLVTAAAPAGIAAHVKADKPEIMIMSLGEAGRETWPESLSPSLLSLLDDASALVVGPGMGRGDDAARFLAALLALPDRPPTVFDADALIHLARRPESLRHLTPRDVLTPHPGEASRLLCNDTVDIQADRPAALRALCALSPAAVVLKGAGTLVGRGPLPRLICPYDVPQLAVAGSGDVLAGCIGALLAMAAAEKSTGIYSLRAAALGVAWHALAGRICAEAYPERGNTPTDIANALPNARARHALHDAHEANMPCETEILPWPK